MECTELPTGQCLVCGHALKRPIRKCPSCDTLHHFECWDYNGGCAVFACGGLKAAPAPSMDPPFEGEVPRAVHLPYFSWRDVPVDTLVGITTAGLLSGLMMVMLGFWVSSASDVFGLKCLEVRVRPDLPRAPQDARSSRAAAPVDVDQLRLGEAYRAWRAVDALVRDDRLWQGTGATPAPELVVALDRIAGPQLEQTVSRSLAEETAQWRRARLTQMAHLIAVPRMSPSGRRPSQVSPGERSRAD